MRFLQGEIRRLSSEIKRLKKEKNLDKEEILYDEDGNDSELKMSPCVFCDIGFMSEVDIVGRIYLRCSSCKKTKKI